MTRSSVSRWAMRSRFRPGTPRRSPGNHAGHPSRARAGVAFQVGLRHNRVVLVVHVAIAVRDDGRDAGLGAQPAGRASLAARRVAGPAATACGTQDPCPNVASPPFGVARSQSEDVAQSVEQRTFNP